VAALREGGVTVEPTLVMVEATLFAGDLAFRAKRSDAWGSLPAPAVALNQPPDTRRWPADFSSRAQAAWPKILAFVKRLHGCGIRILPGTDCSRAWVPPGVSLHRELVLLERVGLSPQQVLLSATRDAAEALGVAEVTGTVEAGKDADLLLLSRNPLEGAKHFRSIEWVMRAGVLRQHGQQRVRRR